MSLPRSGTSARAGASPRQAPLVPRCAAAVLAGGASRRMGRDKALVEVGGLPLVSHVVGAARRAGAAPIAVVGHPAPQRLPADLGVAVVPDLHPGLGPVGGVLTALAWSPAAVVLVLACDLPHLDAGDLARLGDAVDGAHPVAVLVGPHGREPLIGAWHTGTRGRVASAFADGVRALHRILTLFAVTEVPVTDPAALRNVNRPADLADLGPGGRHEVLPSRCPGAPTG